MRIFYEMRPESIILWVRVPGLWQRFERVHTWCCVSLTLVYVSRLSGARCSRALIASRASTALEQNCVVFQAAEKNAFSPTQERRAAGTAVEAIEEITDGDDVIAAARL